MQPSDLVVLKQIRQQRRLRAEREYYKQRRDLETCVQEIDKHQGMLQQLSDNCQQSRTSLGRRHQGVTITFQVLKDWKKKESELLNDVADKSEEISSLQRQCDEQKERVESARVRLQRRQVSMEKMVELEKMLNGEGF